jgi:DNA polymerase III subunit epsilon
MSIFEGPLVFVDIETTGLSPAQERVIEVAAIRVENGDAISEYRQLVEPGKPLPRMITDLTGITQGDLKGAPEFVAIADELYGVLDGAVFVAHNVGFDYSFLKQEFQRVGMHFQPRRLCTMRLSRALYPQHSSHTLASLIDRHDLKFSERHRAYDDAHALWQFMQILRNQFDHETLKKAVAKQSNAR